MATLEQVQSIFREIMGEAYSIIKLKGLDYNRDQQDNDTLFNMSVCKTLGITETETAGILVRLSDKLMRLISLTKEPNTKAAVADEKVKDTIIDSINYLVYLYIKYEEGRETIDESLIKEYNSLPCETDCIHTPNKAWKYVESCVCQPCIDHRRCIDLQKLEEQKD